MARALICHGVLIPVRDPDLGPNGTFFPVPRNREKSSFIVNLVDFNESMRSKPPPLQILSVELATLLMLVQVSGNVHCLPPRVRGDCDQHIFAVWELFSLHALGEGEPLLVCHVDISTCFWRLILPPQYRQSFRICVDDTAYAFKVLTFGRAYSPVICQEVLTHIVRRERVRDVFVLVYYDDIPVIRFKNPRVKPAADAIIALLISEGALVSPKSKLTPLSCIQWIGKQFRFGEGVISRSTNKWSALLARWLLIAVSHCLRKDLLRLVGRVLWESRPSWGVLPFLASTWAHILWAAVRLNNTPLRLLHALVTPSVMVARSWVVFVIRSPSVRRPTQVFFDGGPDANGCRVGVWALSHWSWTLFATSKWSKCEPWSSLPISYARLAGRRHRLWVITLRFCRCLRVIRRGRDCLRRIMLSIKRLVYNWSVAHTSLFLCWVPREYNPAHPWSRLTDDCCGDEALAAECSGTISACLRKLGKHAINHV